MFNFDPAQIGIQRISVEVEVPFYYQPGNVYPPNVLKDAAEIKTRVRVVDGGGRRHDLGFAHTIYPGEFQSQFARIMTHITREMEEFVLRGMPEAGVRERVNRT